MGRNFDHRSEVAVPINDKKIQEQIKTIINILWADNVKARVLNKEQNNLYKKTNTTILKAPAQETIYQLFLKQ
jgi:polyphosphate kinase